MTTLSLILIHENEKEMLRCDTEHERKILSAQEAEESAEAAEAFYIGRNYFFQEKWKEAERAFESFLQLKEGFLENKIDACRFLAAAKEQLGDIPGAFAALYRSFYFDVPRAEVCCDLGSLFLNENLIESAVWWFEKAMQSGNESCPGAFLEEDCCGYLPAIGLCICYDRLGERKKAFRYNEKAATIKPMDKYVALNRKYFTERLGLPL